MQYFCENKRRRRKNLHMYLIVQKYLRGHRRLPRSAYGGVGGWWPEGGDFSHKYTSSGGLNYKCISIQTKFFNNPQDTLKRRVGWSGWLPPRAKVQGLCTGWGASGQKELTVLQDSIFKSIGYHSNDRTNSNRAWRTVCNASINISSLLGVTAPGS